MQAVLELPQIVGDPRFPAFPIVQGVALVVAAAVLRRRVSSCEGARPLRMAIAMAIGCVAGGALLGLALRLPRVLLGRAELFAPGWMMAYGALAGAAGATALAARACGVRVGEALDALAPALGVLVAVGRLGCLLSGCCFGGPSDLPFAVAFPRGTPAFAEHVRLGLIDGGAMWSRPLHPAALYEALVGVAMIAVGLSLGKGGDRRARRGAAFAGVALVYAVGRFAVEFVRADPRPAAGALTLPQWLGVVVTAFVALAWARSETATS